MNKFVDVKCAKCQCTFVVKRKYYLDSIRRGEDHNFFCQKSCRLSFYSAKVEKNCLLCDKKFSAFLGNIKRNGGKFCSSSCSATFNNRARKELNITTKNKTTFHQCSTCNITFEGSVHLAKKKYCQSCSDKRVLQNREKQKLKINKCITCSLDTRGTCLYCDACRSQVRSLNRIKQMNEGKNNFKSIKCTFLFKEKSIRCDSKIEYACLDYFVKNYKIIDIDRSGLILPYLYNGKNKNYVPDFKITTDKEVFIVECKSYVVCNDLNEKWRLYKETSEYKRQALIRWCADNNYTPFWFTKNLHSVFYDKLKI